MTTIHFEYIHDPLCGWCYASAPALKAIAAKWPQQLTMLTCGLFSDDNAQPLTREWAQYAWKNDQRIAALTGQVFSEDYKKKVLLGDAVQFDSTIMSRALTAAAAIEPDLEAQLLHQLQIARYVEGKNTADAAVVATIIKDAFPALVSINETMLTQDRDLISRTEHSIRQAQTRMAKLGVQGVPQLVAYVDDRAHIIESSTLYAGEAPLMQELDQLMNKSTPSNHSLM